MSLCAFIQLLFQAFEPTFSCFARLLDGVGLPTSVCCDGGLKEMGEGLSVLCKRSTVCHAGKVPDYRVSVLARKGHNNSGAVQGRRTDVTLSVLTSSLSSSLAGVGAVVSSRPAFLMCPVLPTPAITALPMVRDSSLKKVLGGGFLK